VPQLPKPEVVEKHGIWNVICQQVPVAIKDGKPQLQKKCYVSATQVDPNRKGLFISVVLMKVKDKKGKLKGHIISLRAPLGVFLPTGIAMEIDGKPVARAPFTRCNVLFCESTNQARKETLARLKKGKKAKFIVYAAPGVGLPVEMELKGFSAAMKKLAELP
jgi:invasion protein IalB